MAATEPFHRATLRTFQRFGANATISPDITATAANNNTVNAGSFKAVLDENITMASLPGGWQQSTEPHDELEVLQTDFTVKPSAAHAITVNSVVYDLAGPPIRDDGVIWRFEVKAR